MKIKWNVIGIMCLVTAILIMNIPITEAVAKTASDFLIEGTTLVKYNGTDTTVSIPAEVTKIGTAAFENNSTITRVNIPSTVIAIEPYAFWGCNQLDTISLANGIQSISDFAFANCKGLKYINIPDSVVNIGLMAFADCTNLLEITIPSSVMNIHNTAFDGCYRLTIQAIEGTTGYKYIEYFEAKKEEMPEYEDVEEYQNVESEEEWDVEEIPQQTETIIDQSNVLGSTSIVGNAAVVFIDNTTQQVTTGEMIIVPKEEEEDVVPYNDDKGSQVVKYTYNNQMVVDHAFYGVSFQNPVSIPSDIKEVGEFSFARSNLTNINIPDSVETIKYGAFYHCDELREISIPNSVMEIEPKAFEYTAWLDNFYKNSIDDFLIVGDQILLAYKGSTTQVDIPEGVKAIAGEVFKNHEEIERVILPSSLVTIGESAFQNCMNLSDIQGGEQVIQIKDRAFQDTNITTLSNFNQLQMLGYGAFSKTNIEEMNQSYFILPDDFNVEFTYENSARRLSNETYRIHPFEGIGFLLYTGNKNISDILNTTFETNALKYSGIIGIVNEENSTITTLCTYHLENNWNEVAIPTHIMINDQRYNVLDVNQLLFMENNEIHNDTIQIIGMDNSSASYENHKGNYTLIIKESDNYNILNQAFQNIYHDDLSLESIIYEIELFDMNSNTSINKLGKQYMTITLPIPELLRDKELQVITLDRNNQLEVLSSSNNGNYIQFSTNHFSTFSIYPTGNKLNVDGTKDLSPNTGDNIHPKWFLGFGLFFAGISLILFQKIYKDKKLIQ